MTYKTCSRCGEEYEATTEFFHRQNRQKGGLRSKCKECRREKRKDPEVQKKLKEYNYDHHEKYKKIYNQRARLWRKDNPEQVAAYKAKRRARKLNQTPILTKSEDKRIKLVYKKSHELGSDWHVDHIKPLSKNGLHHPNNLQIVTANYNLQKSDKLDFRLPTDEEIYKI